MNAVIGTTSVGYKLRDVNGHPFENQVYDNVKKTTRPDGSYFYTISGLPADTSGSFTTSLMLVEIPSSALQKLLLKIVKPQRLFVKALQ
ncbi:MAG: hypothetical protein IPH94_18805 [Saprospiraceae bacterium]|nr:hypothetical protein [Saprospiraceae bacterium]